MSHEKHSGCCGCSLGEMGRRSFLTAASGAALAGPVLGGCATAGAKKASGAAATLRGKRVDSQAPLVVQPALAYTIYQRREKTSWRPWGGLHNEADVTEEIARIEKELQSLAKKAEFPIEFRPVAHVTNKEQGAQVRDGDTDVVLIYGATAGVQTMESMISDQRYNLVFVRHKSGPVYLWYEIVHPRLLRKTVDEYGQPGLDVADIIVDEYGDMLWRLRAQYALKRTLGSNIVCIGGPSGWGAGGQAAPGIARGMWRMNLIDVSYDDLGKRIVAARDDAARVRASEAAAKDYLRESGTELHTDAGFVSRAFLLTDVFKQVMDEADAPAVTVNHCMGTIMPLAETTACLTLSLLNDDGYLAFCESDFAVIPSGVLLHHISGLPVFLQDPTFPHHGVVTLAHCTAPRRMDGEKREPAKILTHYESDYGAAPKVEMKLGQTVTVLDPDFEDKRWIGFRGAIADNPFLDICRSQVDVTIEGDCEALAREMRGFHWMLCYGDHLRETGYALGKLGVDWLDLSHA